MPIFYHKNVNPSVTLRGGYDKYINGKRIRKEPIKAHFKNHIFDTKSKMAQKLPLEEEEIIEALRDNKNYGIDYWEKEKDPVSLTDLLETGIRGLPDVLEEVKDIGLLQRAIQAEENRGEDKRKMAVDMFKKKIKELIGEDDE